MATKEKMSDTERISKIIKDGKIDVMLFVNGIRQRQTLKIEKEKTGFGIVPFLVSDYRIPKIEMIRLAKELGLPIKTKDGKAFPPGKFLKDFVGLVR